MTKDTSIKLFEEKKVRCITKWLQFVTV